MAAMTALAIAAIGLSAAASAKTLLTKPPKAPTPPKPIEPPKPINPGTEMSKKILRARQSAQYNQSGRTSTILTGPRGVTDGTVTPPKTLLGQ